MIRRFTLAITLTHALLSFTGCGPYVLKGKVVDGATSHIYVVRQDDAAFESIGIPHASIEVIQDPESLGRKIVANGSADADGQFALPINEFGAGLLEYDYMIIVRRPEYDTATEVLRLPPGNKRLLVKLMGGTDQYKPKEDPLRGVERLLRNH